MEDRQTEILIISVHFRSNRALLEMLASLKRLNGSRGLYIIIVDNSSGEEELARIRPVIGTFPNAVLLELTTNRGYFGAALSALDHYREQGRTLAKWVIVCNHDVVINDSEFVTK